MDIYLDIYFKQKDMRGAKKYIFQPPIVSILAEVKVPKAGLNEGYLKDFVENGGKASICGPRTFFHQIPRRMKRFIY